jgi:hypothetical protein
MSCGALQSYMEFITEEGMDTQIYIYNGYNSKELVSRDGNVKINKKLG